MTNFDALLYVAVVLSFTLGGVMGIILKDSLSRHREYGLAEDLKAADVEILRLRAQVALHIGKTI